MSASNRGAGSSALAEQGDDAQAGNQGPAGNENPANEPEQSVPPALEQQAGPNESAVDQQQPQTEQPAPHILRDLVAQETMAEASFWMAVAALGTMLVTMAGTLLIWRQVSLTRKAVRDTGDATKAMVRQNELTDAAQRPWIALAVEITAFRQLEGSAISVDAVANFTNTGKTVAENFYGQVKLVPMNDPFMVHIRKWFDGFETEEALQKRDTAVIPGQSFPARTQLNYTVEHLPWTTDEGFRKDCYFMALVMCRYRISGDDQWRYSMQSYSVGEHIDNIDNYKLIYDSVRKLSLDQILVQPLGLSRFT